MSKHDELDEALYHPSMTSEDFDSLSEVLSLSKGVPEDERRILFNREIRHSYGHSVVNLFRDWYEPDYLDIVKGTAEELKIHVREHHSLEDIEDKILIEVIELAKANIIKEKGKQAWSEIERSVEEQIQQMVADGKIPQKAGEELKKARGAAFMAALLGGRLAGFGLYIVANQVFFSIARQLGLRVGVAIVGPIIGRVLAFLLGPIGWALGGALLIFDLGNTNWKKVIPAVVMVISFRRRSELEDSSSV